MQGAPHQHCGCAWAAVHERQLTEGARALIPEQHAPAGALHCLEGAALDDVQVVTRLALPAHSRMTMHASWTDSNACGAQRCASVHAPEDDVALLGRPLKHGCHDVTCLLVIQLCMQRKCSASARDAASAFAGNIQRTKQHL